MLARYFDDDTAIQPEDLKLLQEVFDTLRGAQNLEPSSPVAEELASSVVQLFKGGFRTRQELLHMLASQGKLTEN